MQVYSGNKVLLEYNQVHYLMAKIALDIDDK